MQSELLVASANSDAIYRFEEISGAYLQQIGVGDDLDYAVDVTVGPDGFIYVSGYNSNNVLRYDQTTGAFDDRVYHQRCKWAGRTNRDGVRC